MSTLIRSEFLRYSRHLNLPQFGQVAQEQLKAAKVLVVGAGGLGAPLLQYLTAAGVGTIGVLDFDFVDESNLQRQVLFGVEDLGKPKTAVAIEKLKGQNPFVNFLEFNSRIDSANALEIISQFDVVADGTDNFPTRYLLNDACFLAGKPNVYGSIYRFEGQVSVFNYQNGPNYRDLFPVPPPPNLVPSCADGGVLGVLPGIIGSLQASEVIKVITGIGETLSGRLFLFDALDFTSRTVNIRKDPENPLSGKSPSLQQLIDYEAFCGWKISEEKQAEISVLTLKSWQQAGKDFQLIDVREPFEHQISNLSEVNFPVNRISNFVGEISRDKEVVLYCKSGSRSATAIYLLESDYGFTNLINLKGGILAWKKAFAPQMKVVL